MSISFNDAEQLRHDGFTDYEINELARAKTTDGKDQPTINIDSPAWRSARFSRIEWRARLEGIGYTSEMMNAEVEYYYRRDSRRSVWDFIKAEYRPTKRTQDFLKAARRRAQNRVNNLYGE